MKKWLKLVDRMLACSIVRICGIGALLFGLSGWTLFAQVAPTVSGQIGDRVVLPGESVILSANVSGTNPLSYQWLFNDVPLSGKTNSLLTLNNVQVSQGGTYGLTATNTYGSATWAVAHLAVLPDPPPTVAGGWGLNDAGQILAPTNLMGVLSIHAGFQHVVALKSGGSVSAWGNNTYQQLNIPAALTNATALAAGGQHNLGLRSDGTVFAWGDDSAGQSLVPDGLSNVVAIAAGGFHSLALKNNGTVAAWGNNNYGQSVIPPGLVNPIALSAGGYFSVALLENGRVVGWGFNGNGQTNVPATLTNATAISAGFNHCLALRSDGIVVAWGHNGSGQTNVPSGLSNVVAVAAGFNHSLALKSDGTVVGWGDNTSGQSKPPATATRIVAIAAGYNFNVAITPAPFIHTVPADQLLTPDTDAAFTVEAASVLPMSFQWLLNGTNIVGATNSSYTVFRAQPAEAGSYSVEVSNLYGAVRSPAAVLSAAPTIQLSPANQIAKIGDNLLFAVSVTSTAAPRYQWLFKGANIPGATSATYIRSNAQPVHIGDYRVVVNSAVGSITSPPAWLSLVSSNQSARIGGDVSLSITSSLPMTFQWQFNNGVLAGQTNRSLNLTNLQLSQSGNYQVLADDGANALPSSDITVTVFSLPAITDSPVSQSAVLGSNVAFTVDASGTAPLAYQWFFNNSRISLATNPVLNILGAQDLNVGTYKVSVNNYAGSATSAPVILTLNYPPTVIPPADQSVPEGTNVMLNATVIGTLPLAIQWLFNGQPLPGANANPLLLTNVKPINAGEYSIVVKNSYGAMTSSVATLIVKGSSPWFAEQPHTRVSWTGVTVRFAASVRGSEPINYQWHKDGIPLAGQTNLSLVLDDIQLPDGGRYSVTASNAVGTTASRQATLRVIPIPSPGTVVTWGSSYGMSGYVPNDLCGAVAISGATSHSLALLSDGTVRIWGANDFGQLEMPPGLSNVVAIDGGSFHSIVLRQDGSVVAWGDNWNGQCTVPDNLKPSIAISAGGDHCVVLQEDGTVAAWGNNNGGEWPVPAGLSNVIDVAAGGTFNLALKVDGTVVAWGLNDRGQVTVPPGLTNVTAIAAGYAHALALKKDGTVVAWGDQTYEPFSVPSGLMGVVAIAAGGSYNGYSHSLALKSDGTLVGWGNAYMGVLTFPPGLSNVTAVASAGFHVLVLKPGLAASEIIVPPVSIITNAGAHVTFSANVSATPISYQWQFNGTELSGATNSSLVLTNVQNPHAGNYAVAVTSCAGVIASALAKLTVVAAAPVITNPVQRKSRHPGEAAAFRVASLGTEPFTYQWFFGGASIFGATNVSITLTNLQSSNSGSYQVVVSNSVGMARATYSLTILPPYSLGTVIEWGDPLNVPPVGVSGIVDICAGRGFSLARRSNGTLLVWGDNSYQQTTIPDGLSNVVRMAVGNVHGLAIVSDGTLVSWGFNYNGQATPPSGLEDVESVAGGNSFSVAAKADGSVAAWGNNFYGVLSIPVSATNIAQVAAGQGNVVALRYDGTVIGWGDNSCGQLSLLSTISNAVAVAAGDWNTMALLDDGTVRVFGNNLEGSTEVPEGLSNVISIASIHNRCLAAKSDGTVVGWGANSTGLTVPPAGLSNVLQVAAGSDHSLVLKETGCYIYNQPHNITARTGTNILFSAGAVGVSALTYQWFFNSESIPQATNDSLKLDNVQLANAGSYSLRVTSTRGTESSVPAVLTVVSPPNITVQPQNQTSLSGTTALFSATVTGTSPILLRWLRDGLNLVSKTNATLILTNVVANDAGNYILVATNLYGSVTSQVAQLIVGVPAGITLAPSNCVAVTGSDLTLAVIASGTPPFAYQWFRGSELLLAETNSNLQLISMQSNQAGLYSVVVTNSFGSCASSPFLLGVVALSPTILSHPMTMALYFGSSGQLSVTAAGAMPLSYQWSFKGNALPGATASVLPLVGVDLANEGEYRVVVSNAFGVALSEPTMLKLNLPPNVFAWGSNQLGQANVPEDLTNAVAIAAGSFHSLAIRADSTVVAWGDNSRGQCLVPPGLSNVIAVSAGEQQSLALRADGALVGWGATNSLDVTNSDAYSVLLETRWGAMKSFGEANPPTPITNAIAIAAGSLYSLAVLADGTVTGWGYNAHRQATPPAGLTNVVSLAAGYDHSVALLRDGTVTGWGNYYGEPNGLSNVVMLAAAQSDFQALRSNGQIASWHIGNSGRLNYVGPTNAVWIGAGGSNASKTSGGVTTVYKPHFLAALSNGLVYIWGDNPGGVYTPPAGLSNVIAVASGYSHKLALVRSPIVTLNPVSQTVQGGAAVVFSAAAAAQDGFQYQWQRDGTNLAGETGSQLILHDVGIADAGFYRLVASNQFGSVCTSPAQLMVIPQVPVVVRQPVGVAAAQGDTATFSVAAVGTGALSYQWLFNGLPLENETSSSLTVSNVEPSLAGFYSVAVANAQGSTHSSNALLTVAVRDIIIDNQQASVTGPWVNSTAIGSFGSNCLSAAQGFGGNYVSFATPVPRVGAYRVYEWHSAAANRSKSVPCRITSIGGVTTLFVNETANAGTWNLLGTFNFTPAMGAEVRLTDGFAEAGSVAVADAILFRYVLAPPLIVQQPSGQTVAWGTKASFNVGVIGAEPLLFQWRRNGVNISGAISNTIVFNSAREYDTGSYTALVTSPDGAVLSQPALLQVTVSALSAQSVAGRLVLDWQGPGILQTSTNVLGPFFDLPAAVPPFTNLICTDPQRFFRLW